MKSPFSILAPAIFLGATATPLAAQVYTPPPPPVAPAEANPAAPAENAFFGVVTDPLPEALRHHLPMLKPGVGLLVREVWPNSPAAAAGIGTADILVRWNDQMLVHPAQLEVLVKNTTAGDKVPVRYLRRGTMAVAEVTLAARPAGPQAPARPERGFHFQQSPDGKSFRLDIDSRQLEDTLRNLKPEEILRNLDVEELLRHVDVEGIIRELDLERRWRELDLDRRLMELDHAIRELDLENRIQELKGALQSLNLEGIGQDGILGLLRELNRQQGPPPVEPGAAPEAPAPGALPDLLQQIDPNTLRQAAKALDLQNLDPTLVEGALQKLQRDGLDPLTLKQAAESLGIENIDPKMIDEAVKAIDPALIEGLLESFGGKTPAPPAAGQP